MIALIDNNGYEGLVDAINEKANSTGVHNISELTTLVNGLGGGIPKNSESTFTITTTSGSGTPYIHLYACDVDVNCTVLQDGASEYTFDDELAIGSNEITLTGGSTYTITISDTYNCGLIGYNDIDTFDELSLGCTEYNPMVDRYFRFDITLFSNVSFGSNSTTLLKENDYYNQFYFDCTKYTIDFTNVISIHNDIEVDNYYGEYTENFNMGNTIKNFNNIALNVGTNSIPSLLTIPSSVETFNFIKCITTTGSSTFSIGATRVDIGDSVQGSNLRAVGDHFLGNTDGASGYGYVQMDIYYYGDSVPEMPSDTVLNPYTYCIIWVKNSTIRDTMRSGMWQQMFPKWDTNENIITDGDTRPSRT